MKLRFSPAIALVARYEFLEVVRNRSFLITLLGFPLIMLIGMIFGGVSAQLGQKDEAPRVLLVDTSGRLAPAMLEALGMAQLRQQVRSVNTRARAALKPAYRLANGLPNMQKLPALLDKPTEELSRAELRALITSGGIEGYIKALLPFLLVDESSFSRVLERPKLALFTPVSKLAPGVKPEDLIDGVRVNAVLFISQAGGQLQARLLSKKPVNGVELLRSVLASATLQDALQAAGQSALIETLVENPVRLQERVLDPEKSARDLTEFARKAVPLVLSFALIIILQVQAGLLLTSTIEERANRVIEVLASTIPINQLFWGKMLGSFGVGVVLLLFWGGGATLLALVIDNPFMIVMRETFAKVLTFGLLVQLLLYFILGYAFYSALYLGVGSLCNSLREVQTLLLPINMIFLVVASGLIGVSNDAESSLAVVTSWIPPATPFIMPARLASQSVAWWEVLGTLALTSVTVLWILNTAARLFRHAALRGTSAAPGFGEFWRLLSNKPTTTA
jgi:ABC-2 type transport system permease protein